MTWKLTMEDLEESCAHAHNRALSQGVLAMESWGRAERWLDRRDGGATHLRAVVLSLAERWLQVSAGRKGGGFLRRRAALDIAGPAADPARIAARIAGLCHLCGDDDKAKLWLGRADAGELDEDLRSAVRYLRVAHEDIAVESEPGPVDGLPGLPDLLLAARLGDRNALVAAREQLLKGVRAGRVLPGSEGNVVPLSRFDWLEETFVVEAYLSGQVVPSHREMLRRSDLWAEESRDAATPAPAGWRASISAGGGVASVEVDQEGSEMTIDLTSTASYFRRISVGRPTPQGEYFVQLFGEHPEEPEQEFDAEYDFRESLSHAVDWLRVDDNGRIEANVIQQILEQLPTNDPPPASATTTAPRHAPAGWTDEITLPSGASASLEVNPSGIRATLTVQEPGAPASGVEVTRRSSRMHEFIVYANADDFHPAVDPKGREHRRTVGPDFPQALEAVASYLESPDGPGLTTPAASEAIRALAQRLPA